MSNFVKFTKTGLVAFDWSGEKKEYVPDSDPAGVVNLRSRCEIDPGVTLGEIFSAVEADPMLMDVISFYSWCKPIREFHEQAKLPPPPPKDGDVKIVEILIDAFAELHSARKKRKILEDKPLQFEGVWVHFSGIGEDGVNYSISYTPMNELANVPVRLSNTCTFNKDFEKMFDQPTEYTFSLLEVLDAIYWDISFYGGPQDNVAFIEKLHAISKEIEDGTIQTVPFNFHDEDDEDSFMEAMPEIELPEVITDSSLDPQK